MTETDNSLKALIVAGEKLRAHASNGRPGMIQNLIDEWEAAKAATTTRIQPADDAVERAVKAIQKVRDEIGSNEYQRIAFAYAEAAVRAALATPQGEPPEHPDD